MTGKHKALKVAELDQAELTVRLLEIGCKLRRPPGASGSSALAEVRRMAADGKIPAYIVADFEAMALTAILYLKERVDDMQSVQ